MEMRLIGSELDDFSIWVWLFLQCIKLFVTYFNLFGATELLKYVVLMQLAGIQCI